MKISVVSIVRGIIKTVAFYRRVKAWVEEKVRLTEKAQKDKRNAENLGILAARMAADKESLGL